MVLDLLSLDALQKLACTSSHYREDVIGYLNHRKSVLFARFIDDVPGFNQLLRSTNSVVSGSIALQMVLPFVSTNWICKDLDIYVARSQDLAVISYLTKQGYGLLNIQGIRPSYSQSSIHTVVTLSRGEKVIDIIVAAKDIAIRPIFEFHSTLVMNFIAADYLFSAYPWMTSRFRGLHNPLALRDGKRVMGNLKAIAKYEWRGFDIQNSPSAWDLVDSTSHNCGDDTNCPQFSRNSIDGACLWMSLDAKRIPDEDDRLGDPIAIWVLGGDLCDGTELKVPSSRLIMLD